MEDNKLAVPKDLTHKKEKSKNSLLDLWLASSVHEPKADFASFYSALIRSACLKHVISFLRFHMNQAC